MKVIPSNFSLSVRPRRRLAAIVLLGGRVRPQELSNVTGMNLLDLPLTRERTLLGQWVAEAENLCQAWNMSRLPMRILLDQSCAMPRLPGGTDRVEVTLEQDPIEFRGTAGVLRDSCLSYQDEDLVLVANAGQILFSSLVHLATCLESFGAGVAMAAQAHGTPMTLMLVRCGCLHELPAAGYMDMKEQALPVIGKQSPVKVATFSGLVCCGVRTRASYIDALLEIHRRAADPLDENWHSEFEICEPGAVIGQGARLHNSVVLRHATIGRKAVLIRSVAFPGAVIPDGAVMQDKLVTEEGIVSAGERAA